MAVVDTPQNRSAVDERVRLLVDVALREALHEIRQPLATLFALAEAARSAPRVPTDVRGRLTQIVEQAREISDAVASVLQPGAAEAAADAGPTDVDEVVDSVLDGFALTWTGELLRRGHRGPLPVLGSRATIRRCVVNVVDNAVRAAGSGGRVTVGVRVGTDAVRVMVEDDGPGFGHVPSRTGLGLPITRQALEAIGGGLSTVPSRTGGGCVVLALPAADVEPPFSDRSVQAV